MVDSHLVMVGNVVLVTGAGRGLGLALGQAFAEAGATVIFHYHLSSAEASASAQKYGGAAIQADLTKPAEVQRMFTEISTRFLRLDVLINNAGIYPVSRLLEMKAEEWDGVIQSNLRSTFLCTQAAALLMKADGGSIINIASIESTHPAIGHSHYTAAKAGIIQFTRTAARELGEYNIRVNAVSPGLIDRPGLAQDWPEGVNRWCSSTPLNRLGTPADIAAACLFLSSPAASWITGINLVVDGGASTAPAF
jgi:3-oxoacyl-[acyl-carrier protein] reductase